MPSGLSGRRTVSYSRHTMAESRLGIVLIIENDLDTRELFDFTLSGAGFRCVATASAAEALRQAAIVRFDAIVMDLGLPRLEDGVALARELREQSAPSPIIAVSGHRLPDSVDHSLFAAYVMKPIDPDELTAVVRRVTAAQG